MSFDEFNYFIRVGCSKSSKKYARLTPLKALLGTDPFDQMGFHHEQPLPNCDFGFVPEFSGDFQTPVDFASPGELSPPSLPSSPIR
jgi:hypothetical protein